MINFSNEREFSRALDRLPQALHDSAVKGLHEAMDDWMRRARVKAPEDISFLKSEMKTEIDSALLNGLLLSNAYKEGFNYAYFLHEVGSKKGYRPKKPGASLTWLQDTMDAKRSWDIVEKTIRDDIKGEGW